MPPPFESRTAQVLGQEGVEKLHAAHVIVFGLGGVGGYAAEALARAGVGRLTLVDDDRVAESNLNRQILALTGTVGRPKAEVAAERIRQINPAARVVCDEQRLRPGKSEVERLLGDASKLKALTGWAPAFTFEEGLAATIEFLKQNIARYKPDVYNL